MINTQFSSKRSALYINWTTELKNSSFLVGSPIWIYALINIRWRTFCSRVSRDLLFLPHTPSQHYTALLIAHHLRPLHSRNCTIKGSASVETNTKMLALLPLPILGNPFPPSSPPRPSLVGSLCHPKKPSLVVKYRNSLPVSLNSNLNLLRISYARSSYYKHYFVGNSAKL